MKSQNRTYLAFYTASIGDGTYEVHAVSREAAMAKARADLEIDGDAIVEEIMEMPVWNS